MSAGPEWVSLQEAAERLGREPDELRDTVGGFACGNPAHDHKGQFPRVPMLDGYDGLFYDFPSLVEFLRASAESLLGELEPSWEPPAWWVGLRHASPAPRAPAGRQERGRGRGKACPRRERRPRLPPRGA